MLIIIRKGTNIPTNKNKKVVKKNKKQLTCVMFAYTNWNNLHKMMPSYMISGYLCTRLTKTVFRIITI